MQDLEKKKKKKKRRKVDTSDSRTNIEYTVIFFQRWQAIKNVMIGQVSHP